MTAFVLLLAGLSLAAWLLGLSVFWVVVLDVIALAGAYVISTSRERTPPSSKPDGSVQPPPGDAKPG